MPSVTQSISDFNLVRVRPGLNRKVWCEDIVLEKKAYKLCQKNREIVLLGSNQWYDVATQAYMLPMEHDKGRWHWSADDWHMATGAPLLKMTRLFFKVVNLG